MLQEVRCAERLKEVLRRLNLSPIEKYFGRLNSRLTPERLVNSCCNLPVILSQFLRRSRGEHLRYDPCGRVKVKVGGGRRGVGA